MRTSKLIFCTTFSDKFWERVIRRRRKEMRIPGGRIVSLVIIPERRDEEMERERWGGRERWGKGWGERQGDGARSALLEKLEFQEEWLWT